MTKRLLIAFLSIVTLVLIVMEVPLGLNFARHERGRVLSDIERDATAIGSFAEDTLEHGESSAQLLTVIQRYTAGTGARVVVVDTKGRSVVDSSEPTTPSESFASRPEIIRALDGHFSTGTRHSNTIGGNLLYAAVPVGSGGVVHGAVRVTFESRTVDKRILHNWFVLAGIGTLILASTGLIGWALARSMAKPVTAVGNAAAALARGDLSARAPEREGPADLRALSRVFNDMAARLEELISAQQEFVSNASHELRTPLTAMRLRLENLEDEVAGPAKEDLEGAAREVRRMTRVVEGLLALARAEAEQPQREDIDAAAVVMERANVWRPLVQERGIAIDVEPVDGATAVAVPGYLEQIVDNLVANAIEASPSGTSIRLSVVSVDGRIEVHVVDHGAGMTDEERIHAFDRFWRKDPSRPGGSGLGLAIARQLAVVSGGDIVLDAVHGGGVDATVRLPSR